MDERMSVAMAFWSEIVRYRLDGRYAEAREAQLARVAREAREAAEEPVTAGRANSLGNVKRLAGAGPMEGINR